MTIPEILKQLEPYTGTFPMEAMKAAVEQREAITPELLKVLESVAADPAEWARRKDNFLPMMAIFLLAQFREKAAYPLVVKIVRAPDEILDPLFGDMTTGGLDRILASVYDGNPTPLHELVECEQVDEFVRDAALRAFHVLVCEGQMPREVLLAYMSDLFHGKLERTPSFAWDGLVGLVADLPAPELLEEVRQAYANNLADKMVADLEEIEQGIKSPEPMRQEGMHFITDAIAELEIWACFRGDEDYDETPEIETPLTPTPPPASPAAYVAPQPFVREPKIGRNDPCPCGSGKKYKKCCGKG